MTMEIAVHPDGTVLVKAPQKSEIQQIEDKVRKRARWILKQLNYFDQFQPITPPRSFVNGETHLYLGKQYRLKISSGTISSVKLANGYFNINCLGAVTPEKARTLLNTWYNDKAKLHFHERFENCWLNFSHRNVPKPELSIKRLQKRWGSLSEKGTLTLNSALIRAPKECIDYVITHELCHIIHHNHSPEFYKLLETVMPDWEQIKHKLELTLS
jgi:predicted metal-dependent hydrolase